MPCPHSNRRDHGRDSRRDFLKAAVAIGGTSALSACLDWEDGSETGTILEANFPGGRTDTSTLPDEQVAWQEFQARDRFGNETFPQHQSLLFLEYTGPVPPREEDRSTVERAFETLERAFQRGTGGESGAVHHEGLLFTVGYSPAYFDRFDEPLHPSVELPWPEEVIDQLGDDVVNRAVDGDADPDQYSKEVTIDYHPRVNIELHENDPTPDHYDAVVHLASGYGSIVLACEEALFGEIDRINGVDVEGDLSEVFEVAERRTGFIGQGQPAENYDHDEIPESAQLSMGQRGVFQDNQPEEERILLRDGPFAGGTLQHVSRIELDLDTWYDDIDHETQIQLMFSPEHTPEQVGTGSEKLAGDTQKSSETVERIESDAREHGLVGHGQKTAKARDEDFVPKILRRDVNITDQPGMHFVSLQRRMDDFVETRKAMESLDLEEEIDRRHNGILDFMDVTNRGNYLVPPRSLRSLPLPQP